MRLLLSPEHFIERRRLVAWTLATPNPHHQSDVKRQREVQAREIALQIEIREAVNDPPAVLVRGHIPHGVLVPDDDLRLDLLDVPHGFLAATLALDVVDNVLFACWIVIDGVAR